MAFPPIFMNFSSNRKYKGGDGRMRPEKNLPTNNCNLKNQSSLSIPVKMINLSDKGAELKDRILNIY